MLISFLVSQFVCAVYLPCIGDKCVGRHAWHEILARHLGSTECLPRKDEKEDKTQDPVKDSDEKDKDWNFELLCLFFVSACELEFLFAIGVGAP